MASALLEGKLAGGLLGEGGVEGCLVGGETVGVAGGLAAGDTVGVVFFAVVGVAAPPALKLAGETT